MNELEKTPLERSYEIHSPIIPTGGERNIESELAGKTIIDQIPIAREYLVKKLNEKMRSNLTGEKDPYLEYYYKDLQTINSISVELIKDEMEIKRQFYLVSVRTAIGLNLGAISITFLFLGKFLSKNKALIDALPLVFWFIGGCFVAVYQYWQYTNHTVRDNNYSDKVFDKYSFKYKISVFFYLFWSYACFIIGTFRIISEVYTSFGGKEIWFSMLTILLWNAIIYSTYFLIDLFVKSEDE